MEKFGDYKFEVRSWIGKGEVIFWYYNIFDDDEKVLRQSKERFQYEGIARFAAIGHISLLEQGKG